MKFWTFVFLLKLVDSIYYENDCNLSGLCMGEILTEFKDLSFQDCQVSCSLLYDCYWTSYEKLNDNCLLFQTCPTLDESQIDYVTNPRNCLNVVEKTLLVITTGWPWEYGSKTEVFDLKHLDRKCRDLDDYASEMREANGALLEDYPLICGGYDGEKIIDDCYTLGSNQSVVKLKEPRSRHAALALPNGSLWLLGGVPDFKSTTEIVFVNKTSIEGPQLPISIRDHCVSWLTASKVILMGGFNGDAWEYSNQSFIFDFNSQEWTQGPSMSKARNDFGCARFFSAFHQSWIVSVTGGFNSENKTNTVELYGKGLDSWIEGPPMPYLEYWYGGAIVTNPSQNGILVTGGYSRNGYETKLTEMTCPKGTGCHWKVWISAELKAPRLYHVAFLLNENSEHNCTSVG